jgi:hypothetical protein
MRALTRISVPKTLGFFLSASLFCLSAHCQTFQVTTTADSGPGSLRDAMANATAAGGGTIVFTNVSGMINLQSALPDISGNVAILGNGSATVAINGYRTNGIFNVLAGANCNITDLTLQGGGPALSGPPYPVAGGSSAIVNAGALSISNCFLHDNGSGNYDDGGGGAVYSTGPNIVLNNVIFSNNLARPPSALWASNVRATNCLFARNASGDSSPISVGDSVFSDCTFYGNGAWFAADGGGINAGGNLTVLNCSIIHNDGDFSTGGIYFDGNNLTISNSVINNNQGHDYIGGIYARGSNIVILNSSICGNEGFDNYGGLKLDGNAYMSGCTIASNTCVFNSAGICNFGALNITNCTISGNSGSWDPGAGIENYGTVQAVNCTIAFNGEGAENLIGGSFYALNTLIANNELGDFSGTLTSQGYNLIGNLNTNMTIVGLTNGNIYGLDPLLGPLQNNGGPTATHALLPGSPAIDAGTAAGAPMTDQRGAVRPFGMAVDIGAFESVAGMLSSEVRITGISRADSNIHVRVEGPHGSVCTIQASSNLLDWEDVSVCGSNAMGAWDFIDHDTANHPNRFYRARIDSQ